MRIRSTSPFGSEPPSACSTTPSLLVHPATAGREARRAPPGAFFLYPGTAQERTVEPQSGRGQRAQKGDRDERKQSPHLFCEITSTRPSDGLGPLPDEARVAVECRILRPGAPTQGKGPHSSFPLCSAPASSAYRCARLTTSSSKSRSRQRSSRSATSASYPCSVGS